ncbi:hypothetical protein B0J11DRAFT_345656 [Dendryphion nanum]|uniref:Uncharacterized protein n=1 Tax=Dendryphion nanum TaxID=256645 RepID=A0A9P9IKM2_9PLEO|nr:hypothetical protein B0J11DRAFT_345656 [Dendryphion nanum]
MQQSSLSPKTSIRQKHVSPYRPSPRQSFLFCPWVRGGEGGECWSTSLTAFFLFLSLYLLIREHCLAGGCTHACRAALLSNHRHRHHHHYHHPPPSPLRRDDTSSSVFLSDSVLPGIKIFLLLYLFACVVTVSYADIGRVLLFLSLFLSLFSCHRDNSLATPAHQFKPNQVKKKFKKTPRLQNRHPTLSQSLQPNKASR